MNLRTIGCIELNSIGMGMLAADEMVKAAEVSLVVARTTCPGRYLVIITGDVGAVKSSVEVGCQIGGDMVVDWFVIPSVHADIVPALHGGGLGANLQAIGIIETSTSASCINAADAAAKAASVELLDIRFASGLAGKAFLLLTGDVGSVKAAVEAGVAHVQEVAPVLSHIVIPSPSEEFKAQLL